MPDTLKLLPATSDYIFKRVFGTEQNIDILKSFLEAVLVPPHNLDNIRIKNPHILPEEMENKEVIFDVKVSNGERGAENSEAMDIEIQALSMPDMLNRIVYYLGRIISSYLSKGDEYWEVGKSVVIMVMDFNLVKDAHYYHRFRLHDPDTGIELTDMVQVYTLELPKLPAADDGTQRWAWLRLIGAKNPEDLAMVENRTPQLSKASSTLKDLAVERDAREFEEAREKYR
ncbi:MAG: Rpn family recombination-promoting nuclease/putative transposase, partial [Methylobacteriaceae bacterium]|nr:Rpn family recombination-promoting nuclease/putative transposase [Methylobacteriaceae bacterium]